MCPSAPRDMPPPRTALKYTDLSREAQEDAYTRFCFDIDGNLCARVLGYSRDAYDGDHKFIQCAFPNSHVSSNNPRAPLFNPRCAHVYKRLFDNRQAPWLLLMQFLGSVGLIHIEGNVFADKALPRDSVRALEGHSKLRMTRVLWFLNHIGATPMAHAILNCLLDLVATNRIRVSPDTVEQWTRAAVEGTGGAPRGSR